MNTEGKKIISDAAKIVTIPTLKILSNEHWNVFMTLISAHPTLLCNDFWLSLSINKVAILLPVIENIAGELINYWDKILNYVLQHRINISSNFASKIHSFYPQAISDILDFMQLNANVRLTRNIDNLCITYTAEVIKWVELKDSYTPTTIRYIIHTVSPISDTTRAKGVTPWIKFAGIDSSLVDINYQIFLFRLALNWKSTNALSILKSSFYIIHLAMSKDELSYQEMNLLRPYFAELPFWQNWDNCKKLRKGVVKAMKRLSYTRNNIEHFTPSEELNTILLKIWDK
jgi:hypothetical protein